jgi:hypothetical protein
MKKNPQLETKALLEEAKASEHGEAYKTLNRNPNCRVGLGARLASPGAPSFFIEILIYLCPSSGEADLRVLEKSLKCLKELQARSYSLTCQDDNCISCETTVPEQSLAAEYEVVNSLIKSVFR